MRKWRVQKRIPLSKAGAMDRYQFAYTLLDNLDELLRVSDLIINL